MFSGNRMCRLGQPGPLPTEGAGRGEGNTAPLKWEGIPDRKSGSDLRRKNGHRDGRINSYPPQNLATTITNLEGWTVCLCVEFVYIQACVHIYSEKSPQQATPSKSFSFGRFLPHTHLEKILTRSWLLIIISALKKTSLGNFNPVLPSRSHSKQIMPCPI